MAKTLAHPPNKFLVLLTTTTVQALVTMNVVIPAAIAPEMAAMLDVEPAMVGFQIGIAYFGAALLFGHVGNRGAPLGGVAGQPISLDAIRGRRGAMAVPSLSVLAVGAVFCGLGYALTNPPASHLLSKVTTPNRPEFPVFHQADICATGRCGGWFHGAASGVDVGPQAPLILGVAVTVAVALPCSRCGGVGTRTGTQPIR